MPKNPHADFSPVLDGYSGIGAFRFWCQTALPLTYDDSLSYYELLCKVVNYLNHAIEDLSNVEENTSKLAEAYTKLQNYVNEYFDKLDIEEELKNILDTMAQDGTLDALLDPLIMNHLPTEVSNWLTANVNPIGSAVMVDKSLTIDGAAADAKVTGDEIDNLKYSLYGLKTDLGAGIIKTVAGKNMFNKNTVHTGKKLDRNTGGYTSTDYPAWFVSDYIIIEPDTVYTLRQSNTAIICYYDNEQTYLNIYNTPTVNEYNLTTPENAKYLRFAFMNNYLNSEQLEKGTAFTSYESYKLFISDESDLDISDNVKTIVEGMGLSPIDFSRLNLAYIKDGKCVCNDEKSSSLTSTAKYIGADLSHDIVSAEIRFGFHSETNSGDATIMLITTKLGCSSTAHIVNGSCHFAVNRAHALIEYFDENHDIIATHDHVFAEQLAFDTEYAFKWKIVNSNGSQWVTVTYPDGDTETLTHSSDAQFWETNGRYIIFEHFYDTSSPCRPYYTGWYARADDNGNLTYLRHDISAYSIDGPLTVAPTGQTYTLFSNEIWGGTTLDIK